MDHVELWEKAKALIREELANVSYTTWIEQPLKPVYVLDDKLALEVISDFNEKTIRARYLPMGFSHFKIEGRGLGSAVALEFLLYYLTKPEYQLKVREKIYLDSMLDLF